jgi:hypothetical protein
VDLESISKVGEGTFGEAFKVFTAHDSPSALCLQIAAGTGPLRYEHNEVCV